MKAIGLALACTLVISSCTWVKVTTEGEKVRVLSKNEVASCKKVGKTSVSLLGKVAGIERNEQKVQVELETMARNVAPGMKGDTVVSVSKVVDGEQTFDIYRCVNPWEAN